MFEIEGLQRGIGELRKFINRKSHPVEDLTLIHLGENSSQMPYVQGEYFGHKDTFHEIVGRLTVPDEWVNERVELEIYSSKGEWDNSTNPQMKVWLNDVLIQGMDVNHQEVLLPDWVKLAGTVDFKLEIYAGREEKQFPIFIKLNLVDEAVRDVFYDLAVALKCCMNFEKGTAEYLAYYPVLAESFRRIDYRDPFSKDFYDGIAACKQYLSENLYEKYDDLPMQPQVTAVGHTHIDIAWLWTVEQAIEKGQRSFSTVLKLMEEYPDYTFIQSQPQLYDLIKQRYPDMYEQIKARVAEGRWETEGAMWVEADCNLTSGESLVRQLLYGKAFFKKEFDVDNKILWLPDVFGYSAALPQILKKSGIDYFMTTKLSWNQYNQIPADTFNWRGIDGTEILTHFITTTNDGYKPSEHFTTYNGILEPKAVLGSWKRYGQKEINDDILIAFGYGDGGGGPTRQMLENARRFKKNLPGMPKVTIGNSLDYFKKLEKNLKGKKVPKWMGELYFEYHRGTYTSMAKIKRDNRKAEYLLQSIEKVYTMVDMKHYPSDELERLWKLVLLNQFHDILPGTSIKEVYEQTDIEFAEIFKVGEELLAAGLKLLASSGEGDVRQLLVFNPLSHLRTTTIQVKLDAGDVVMDEDALLASQLCADGTYLIKVPDVPSLGYKVLTVVPEKGTIDAFVAESAPRQIETPFYQIIFNEQFELISLVDKSVNREILPKGEVSNRFVLYEDLPMGYDAWDVDVYYKNKPYVIGGLLSAELVESGLIRRTIKTKRQFEHSTIVQHIHFYEDHPRIDFETWVDWQHEHNLLKVEFPVDVNTPSATFDIQFGNVTRPVHQNTSWDEARFEVCAQKWADMSEGNYGMSVMTESKYGYDVDHQKIGLTLLRSAMDPCPNLDKGEHHFTYALYPHTGSLHESQTVQLANDLNVPLLVQQTSGSQTVQTAGLTVDTKNVAIDTVKRAEDNEDLILRLFEYQNRLTKTTVTFPYDVAQVSICDLMEQPIEDVVVKDKMVEIELKPFEIVTLRVKR